MVAVDSVAVSRFLTQLLFVGITGSIVTSFLFVLEYTGREHEVTHRLIALLSIEPICVVMLAFVNPGRVFIEAVTSDPAVPSGITVEWGIAAGLHTIDSSLSLLAATLMILDLLYRSRSLYRGQAAALLGATAAASIANAVYVFALLEFDPTPVDIVPIARDRVLDNVSDAVFVADTQDRHTDANLVARELLEGFQSVRASSRCSPNSRTARRVPRPHVTPRGGRTRAGADGRPLTRSDDADRGRP